MSTQRGNTERTRTQKYKNTKVFKNNLHDTSDQTKVLNAMDIRGCCPRCKDVIQWKIKYKKYKPLTVNKKCVGCSEKNVKRAYYILCDSCIKATRKCGKCGQKNEAGEELSRTAAEEASLKSQLEQELKLLPERKRRTFQRLNAAGKLEGGEIAEGDRDDGGDSGGSESEADSDVDGDSEPRTGNDNSVSIVAGES